MSIVTLQSETPAGAPVVQPAAPPAPASPVLTAEGEPGGAKGVQVTARALEHIRSVLAKENISPAVGGLRLGITGGGCSGLSYNIRCDAQPREHDHIYSFSQTGLNLEEKDGEPATADAPPVRIFVDPKSLVYLGGVVLDYEQTLMRQGFNFINPNSTKSCGCGSSFSV